MVTDLLDKNELDIGAPNDVDGTPSTIEPDRALASPVALQRLIVEARNATNLLKTDEFNRANPGEELPRDVLWELAQPPFDFPRKLDPADHDALYSCWQYSASRHEAANVEHSRHRPGVAFMMPRTQAMLHVVASGR